MVEDIFDEKKKPEKPRVSRHFQPDLMLKTKACNVCGQTLFMYMRICDRCGSIQRPVSGDGMPLPPEEMDVCNRCGKPNIRKEDKLRGKLICDECVLASRQVSEKKLAPETKAAIAAGSISAAAVAATLLAIVGNVGTAASFAVFSVSGLAILIAAGSLLLIRHYSRKRISRALDEEGGLAGVKSVSRDRS